MFQRAQFVTHINDGHMAQAKSLLDAANDESEFKSVDPITGRTLLQEIAASEAFNEALKSIDENAAAILDRITPHSEMLRKEEATGCTAFLLAVMRDCRVTADYLLDYTRVNLNRQVYSLCRSADKQKRTPLHHAIIHCNDRLVGELLKEDDEDKTMFFSRDKSGLYSLALAVKQYRNNPCERTMSIGNQLYFSLPKGPLRTKAVEKKVYIDWGFTSTPLWRYVLRYCARRDDKGEITGIDRNLVDLIEQVCNEGLYVMGFSVDWGLIFQHSKSYSGTPGELLQEAQRSLSIGLPGRTLGQAITNNTLARNMEFMAKAKLSDGSYWLSNMNEDPQDVNVRTSLNVAYDHLALYDNKLYYIPKHTDSISSCIEIKFDELLAGDKKYFDALLRTLRTLSSEGRKALNDDLTNIIALVPLMPSRMPKEVPMLTGIKGIGVTLFSGSTHKASSTSGVSAPAAAAMASSPSNSRRE